jgi:hypothetical protein
MIARIVMNCCKYLIQTCGGGNMGIFKAKGLNAGKPLQDAVAFCPVRLQNIPLVRKLFKTGS